MTIKTNVVSELNKLNKLKDLQLSVKLAGFNTFIKYVKQFNYGTPEERLEMKNQYISYVNQHLIYTNLPKRDLDVETFLEIPKNQFDKVKKVK